MGCDGDVHDASTMVGQHHQHEQEAARRRWDHEEVGRNELLHVIPQERAPRLRGRLPTADHVFGNRRLRDVDPEFQQFTVNSRRAPQRVGLRHRLNQPADVG